jgi:site-specific DNA recombinase
MLTVAYVRVSTDDQVEYSPEAQAKRCRDFARMHELGAATVMADEGWSGKNLDRPEMRRLLELVEAGQIANVVVWRFDRLARNSADFSKLVATFESNCVDLHSGWRPRTWWK